jgi:hypothetical protein
VVAELLRVAHQVQPVALNEIALNEMKKPTIKLASDPSMAQVDSAPKAIPTFEFNGMNTRSSLRIAEHIRTESKIRCLSRSWRRAGV